MQPTIQPSVAPNGPSTSTRNSKLDQIIQNFYTKTAQIIVQGRCTPNHDSRYGKRNSLTKKINKWFNIATEDVDVLREDLKYWRQMAIQLSDKDPPKMIIDVYLDTSKLSHHQSLAVADDNLRWGGVKSQTSDAHIDRILIESWELNLKYPLPQYAVDLPSLYKRSIVFFRTLHSTVRLLPAHDLYRKLHKGQDSDLSIGCRLTSKVVSKPTEIALGSTILENDARNPTKTHTFSDIVTPMGTFGLNVTYRRNCDFKVEDTERDLSAQFIDMDEQFFTPTLAKYQQEYARPRPVSMYSPIIARETRQQSFSPSDPQEIQPRMTRTPNRDSSASSRRASVPYVVSPFKSPFLASSPQAESPFSTARNYTPPSSSEKSRVADSGSFGRKIEFSSSFDKYKSSPTSRNVDASGMMRRSSRASDHSLLFKDNDNNDEDDLEDFVRFVGSNQELRLFQLSGSSESNVSSSKVVISHFQNLRDTHTSLSESLSSSIMISQHESHSASPAPDSASTPTPPPPPSISGISPVSSTSSSTGRSYQPIIPSPLHAEQKKKSTTHVHTPQSYPQLRSLTNPSNALRISRAPLSQNEEEDNQDMFTYSTYPQGGNHQDLLMLRATHSHVLGKATVRAKSPVDRYEENYNLQRSRNTEGSSLMQDHSTTTTDIHSSGQGRTHSLIMDDDDSLVFKMSELECEGAPSNNENNMVFHHRLNPQDLFSHEQFLELTPTPLSSPLLHRLQAISMSTVTEEEEKGLSTSGSSNKSESPKVKHHPFDAW